MSKGQKIENSFFEKLNKEHLKGKSLKELSTLYNVRFGTLYYGFKRLNLKIIKATNQQRQRCYVNNDYFESIDSEIKAYLLGWICSDGYISRRNKGNSSDRIGLKLAAKDVEILNLFKQELSPDRKIYNETSIKNNKEFKSVKLEIPSNKIVNDLIKLGVCYNKTSKEKLPNIHFSLYPAFIRGYFDGDGSISISKNNKSTVYICCTNKLFLEELRNILPGNYSIYKESRATLDMYTLRPLSDTKVKFYNFIYKNANYFLTRKYNKYTEYVNTVLNKESNKSLSV